MSPSRLLPLIGLLGALVMTSPGCCFCRRVFGMNGYQLLVVPTADAFDSGNAEVLLVWSGDASASASVKALADKDWNKKLEEVRLLKEGDLCTYAYLGRVKSSQPLEKFLDVDRDQNPLVKHCRFYELYVFTTFDKFPSQKIALANQKFTGYLKLEIDKDRLDVRFLPKRMFRAELDKHQRANPAPRAN
jgi:hypothetical protein